MVDPRDVFIMGENAPEVQRMRWLGMMGVMRELRFGGNEAFTYICDTCQLRRSHAGRRMRCLVCEDTYICASCYNAAGHPHEVETLSSDLIDHSVMMVGRPPISMEARIMTERSIKSLVHACRCQDWNCYLPSCLKTKRLIQHNGLCVKMNRGLCTLCNQLIAFAGCHAARCKEEMDKCNIHLCNYIREKLKTVPMRTPTF